MRIREVLSARINANEDHLHYLYVEEHKTGHMQPAIMYLDSEMYNYLLIFVMVVIPQLPRLEVPRSGDDSRVFQTWKSQILHSSNVNHCFRAGLNLFGIDDPHGCPTHYRKAASTLISMHRPELQETLSQFMCHSRSTTEKHYRTHMVHRGMYTIFKELGRCQAIEGHVADFVTTPHETPTNLPDSNIETEIDDAIEVDISANTDASDIESVSPLAVDLIDELQYQEELSHPKFHSKWNAKSFLCDQTEEDTFFRVFESLIADSIALRLVSTSDVCRLAQNSEFNTIWERLVEHYGYAAASKKITAKIRTYGRNHRKNTP